MKLNLNHLGSLNPDMLQELRLVITQVLRFKKMLLKGKKNEDFTWSRGESCSVDTNEASTAFFRFFATFSRFSSTMIILLQKIVILLFRRYLRLVDFRNGREGAGTSA
jgi:hypothetical protein